MLTYIEVTFFTQNKTRNNQFDRWCMAMGDVWWNPTYKKLENLCMRWPNCVMEKSQKKDYILHIHAFTY